ncbi:lipid II:glycine glycyltransferase FemX [Georgenia sp. Z1491]|uniref:lipid II:glycine glycyltransferase FemX n=1 Tax=Georgenia sp. Z1491 TaxID=3416707 RepID=UPI003CF78CD9
MTLQLRPCDDVEYRRLTADAAMPVEQTIEWDDYDATVAGRTPWGRLAAWEGREAVAVVSLSKVSVGAGVSWLWAKFGPVWLDEPTPERERALRDQLAASLRRVDPGVAFVRLHARYDDVDLVPVMQGITFDSTVVVDLTGTAEDVLARMKKRGRRDVRRAEREEGLTVTEDTGLDRAAFDELYALFEETGERAAFGVHPADRYHEMMRLVGPEIMRLFVVRDAGRPVAWAQVNVIGAHATYSIGASGESARHSGAPDLLQWEIMQRLQAEGVRTYDLGGVGSAEFDSLAGLTMFKTKFHPDVVPAAAARDLPVRPGVYRTLVAGRHLKQAARRRLAGLRRR